MADKKIVEVVLGQQKLSLRTDTDPAQVQKIADFVNGKLAAIVPKGQIPSQQHLSFLAIQLADELLVSREKDRKFRDQVVTKSEALLTRIEEEFSI
jgi:cell division protein ZapA (FtsZ GTPase activity inhibitor)